MSDDATTGTPFLIDAGGDPGTGPRTFADGAAGLEAAGYDGIFAAETKHDPFVALTAAAMRTERVDLMTGIAVAFARNPMTVAETANDLQLVSGGRFILGLGSQVKPHIERRFSMPWSAPAARMREFVGAVRAIWSAWETGEKLAFDGEHYRHTLMTPFFSPGPNPHGTPPIWIAAVGERMTETAGAVADGLLAHTFTTERYLREVTRPALERGAASAGRDAAALGISVPAFVAIGETDEELARAIQATKGQIAFYGSTPDYLPVLALHGWEGVHEKLNAAARRGEWKTMGEHVDDEMLAAFAAVGSPAEVAAQLRARFGGLATRLSFSASYPIRPELAGQLLAALRTA
ncbi:TIGR03617 family F420-dependent LLM class oxidoreductase [Protaetiibacter intestinalis]|uniref:TIGR03617 family F420-dependent LLM class oxidoreductase n=1 Tax=Protaetiibacter intestinalis TaxID=2419774 RepID=UPI001D046D7E|nr:TIGR03617 family F420-dependent LLM class oxidoreductase [Protaetiibacter intestinalis]